MSTAPFDRVETFQPPSSSSLSTTATSASSTRRTTSITPSTSSYGRPSAARSARVT
ncbi:hypothetical protein [Microbispora sp. GKU 823]|uniref:hypothetical protein n=1 Tax=Microbispora sp. GKU 823 TaxID=1652100 RepID=UPI0021198B3E|nr:hypothetical protein [Microbispora sp. GKU 823]